MMIKLTAIMKLKNIKQLFLCLAAALLVLNLTACVALPENKVTLNQYDDLRDQDHDGVINQRDLCIETDDGVHVGEQGCGQWGIQRLIDHTQVKFDFDSTIIHQQYKKELQRISRVLIDNPRAKVTLIGDTSPEGSKRYNEMLGQRRSVAIEDYLFEYAVPRHRMTRHNFSDKNKEVREVMKTRERRTFLIVYQPNLNTSKEWTVYTTDEVKNPMTYWTER